LESPCATSRLDKFLEAHRGLDGGYWQRDGDRNTAFETLLLSGRLPAGVKVFVFLFSIVTVLNLGQASIVSWTSYPGVSLVRATDGGLKWLQKPCSYTDPVRDNDTYFSSVAVGNSWLFGCLPTGNPQASGHHWCLIRRRPFSAGFTPDIIPDRRGQGLSLRFPNRQPHLAAMHGNSYPH
jgi:hypothetical protein